MSSIRYQQSFEIVAKRELCPDTWYFEVEAPLVAAKIEAGQFVVVRPNERSERMPLSIAGWDRDAGTLRLIIATAGFTSNEATRMQAGDRFADLVGPLGLRSHVAKTDGAWVLLGGGYGAGAILPTARDLKALGNTVYGIVGARSEHLLLMVDELAAVCDRVITTTNDGSAGTKGFVTHALAELMESEPISACLAVGPVPMMEAVADLTRDSGIDCQVSLNAIMLDATGMCGACRVSVGGETKFACVDGPDFDGHLVDYAELMTRQKMFVAQEHAALEHACQRGGGHV